MLTDAKCRLATPRSEMYRLRDTGNLYLLVRPSGTKVWHWRYNYQGSAKTFTIGRYPTISLKEARSQRDQARMRLDRGIDPSAEKQQQRRAEQREDVDSFEAIARQWHAQQSNRWDARYAKHILARLEANLFTAIGTMRIEEITPQTMLAAIRAIEERGAIDMAHRVKGIASDVFVWAIAAGLANSDPAATITKALRPKLPALRPALLKLPELHAFLKDSAHVPQTHWATQSASQLLALTAARPGVVREAQRNEFEDLNGDNPVWRVPAAKMKLSKARKRDASYDFVIPLSRQAVLVVEQAIAWSGNSPWLFPGIGDWRKPISDSTLSSHYRDAGYAGRHVPHGWRASFSTIMNERAALMDRPGDREVIDLMLAHIKGDVEAAYNRASYMQRRREIAQEWADLLMPDKDTSPR